jgi:hypothetical protein
MFILRTVTIPIYIFSNGKILQYLFLMEYTVYNIYSSKKKYNGVVYIKVSEGTNIRRYKYMFISPWL